MSENHDYKIRTDIRFGPQEKFDVGKLACECSERWFNQTLCRVDDSVVRYGVLEGEFHWHKHDDEDEFFMVLQGRLFVDTEEEAFELLPNQAVMIEKGVTHRTRAPQRTVVLMVEGCAVRPAGD